MKYFMITTDMGLRKGGIQIWAHYINELFLHEGQKFDYFIIKNAFFYNIAKLIKANFVSSKFILMDWKKMAFAFISLFLTLIGLRKVKFFVFIFGDEIINLSPIRKKIVQFLVKRRFIKFVADSKSIGDIFKMQFNREIDFVCYPFIDVQLLMKNFKTKMKNSKQTMYRFFTITRLVPRKNLKGVIDALYIIKKRHVCKFKYFIAGDGPEKNSLNQQIQSLKMDNEVILLGNISEEDKIDYFNQSDLFFLPSLYDKEKGSIEGFGIVFIEANAFGIPVVSGNTGGMGEAVIDGVTGFHTDGSTGSIVQAIEKFMKYKFHKKAIVNHAMQFDYRNQKDFLKFIMQS